MFLKYLCNFLLKSMDISFINSNFRLKNPSLEKETTCHLGHKGNFVGNWLFGGLKC